jgi:undecaprenyl-diphosphatase
MEAFYLYQLDLIRSIQQIRAPFLDYFFKFMNLFDTAYFIFFIIPIIWMGFNWKWGIRFTCLMFLSFLFNEVFKNIFQAPRPFDLDPSVGLIYVFGYGFPSGAAQSATIYLGLILKYFKNKKWAVLLGSILFLLMSFSRIYLGVHFFTDLLGGYLIGIFLLFIYFNFFPKIEKYLLTLKKTNLLFFSFIISAIIFFSTKNVAIQAEGILFFVLTLGLVLSEKKSLLLKPSKNLKEGFLRTLLTWMGIGTIVTISYFLKKLNFWSYLYFAEISLGLWISFFASYLWKKLVKIKSID